MASPRGADEASAFETDEDTRAETPDSGDDFVSATAFKSPRGGYACGVADLSSDGEDEHADVVGDDARAFDRAHRRGRASSFRGVDAESRDDSSEGGHSSSESTVRANADATGADDDDDAPRRLWSSREILANDLNQDVLRHVQHVMRLQNDPEAFSADAEDDAFLSSGNENQNDFGDDLDDPFFSSRRDSFPRDDVSSPYERTVYAEVPVDVSSATTTQIDLLNTSLNDLDLLWDPARRDEDDQPKDAFGDSFFTALLELWFNWSSVDKTWFLYRSGVFKNDRDIGRFEDYMEDYLCASYGAGVFENARDDDGFGDYLKVYLCMEHHRRFFASDGETPSEATRRVVDAFVRVFGHTPKTERDFRLCLTPCKTYDIETRAVTGLVFPGPTIGAPPFEMVDFPSASFQDWRDAETFQRLRSMQKKTRALFCDEKKNDDEDEPAWSSPERRMSGREASTRE
jgi:hypothetical protein